MNEYKDITLWVPRDCPMGRNGEVIAETATRDEVEALNEMAREYGGHVQAWALDEASYLTGFAEEEGTVVKRLRQ